MRSPAYILIFFCALAFIGNSQPREVKLLSKIYADSSAGVNATAEGLSVSVIPVSFAAPATILLTGILKKDSALIEKGIKASVAYALNAVATTGLKYYADRRRPFAKYPALFREKSEVGPYSFPSGHTSFAFTAATSLTLSFPKWYVAVPAYAWAGSVAWSRMNLGVHYPTDVLMGAIVGTASAFLTFKIDKLLKKNSR